MASVATALYVNALSFCLLLGCHHISAQNVTAAPIKRGGGWGWKAVDVSGELKAMPVQWWYNWGNYIPDPVAEATTAADSVDFVPMIYGDCCGIDDLPGSLPDTAKTLLGFNEPNHWQESGLYPAQAAQLWPKLQAAAQKRGLRLGSPAAAPCGANCIMSSPFEWWDQFFGNCTGCQIDFINTHLYTCSPQYLQWFLNDVYSRYGLPVWLSEFSCPNQNGTLARQLKYARAAFKVLDEDNNTERYAWFAPHVIGEFDWIGPTASLLEADASPPQLTILGQLYVSSPSNQSAQVESQVAGADALSAEDMAAITEALPVVSKTGSWIEACSPCLGAGLSLLAGSELAHCRDCGLHDSAVGVRASLS